MVGVLNKVGGLVGLLMAAALACAQDFTQHGTQPGLAATLEEPEACATCHGKFFNPPSESYMPHDSWSGSMMSHSTRDPLFWAALDVANRDVPGIGDWCLRCHTSQGWYGGRVRKTGLPAPNDVVNGTNGCLLQGDHDDYDNANNDYSGITCHTCHRMTETGPAAQSTPPGSGNAWIDDSLDCNGFFGPCRYGPKHYEQNSAIQPPHGWAYSAFTTRSAQCGTCHDVSSPIVDGVPVRTHILADGTDTGRAFPAERTYSEWQQSDFREILLADSLETPGQPGPIVPTHRECQDCHMRTSQSANARTCTQTPTGSRTGELSVHEFVGGNSWMLKVIDHLYGSSLQRSEAIQRAVTWAEEMLTQRSATIAVSLDPLASGDTTLQARVRVTNRAGHKLPTGYGEGRRMWLHVVVRDADNALVYESGAWDPATGVLADSPAPKVYEVLQGIWDAGAGLCRTEDGNGRKLFHFALNNCVAKDNRIPPRGFRPATAADPNGEDLRPVAYSYPETVPGSGVLVHHDDTIYAIPVAAAATRPLSVSATLRFQIASKDYIDFLRDEAVNGAFPSENAMCGRSWTIGPANRSRGQFMHDLWADPATGRSPPVDMVTAAAATLNAP
ncbi:MAG TPA: hypothetical protein VN581_07985 [Patescibacteria group bacterium]|nr:hypothetical protein [Patescibacteria group bacterium]